ncbi:MAG: GNAT family N-acetyltransferase [Clostridia bacterium]|nr:GNAT family N-acetyltransferase [Clostridia bacterium]MBR2926792.1 GNAT family N-acetyltransferase [Clostridia bacterium]
MEQLIMRWKNDGTPAKKYDIPEGMGVYTFQELPNALEEWLEIVQYGLSEGKAGPEYYEECMTALKDYYPDKCFFVTVDGEAVATVTVLCDYEKSEGHIHMVACKPGYRGRGIGTLLNEIAMYVVKSEGFPTAFLITDDWRIPAIKSYYRAGFVPDVSTEDFAKRWKVINEKLGR